MQNGKGKGGGVLIAIRSNIRCEQIQLNNYNDINRLCVKAHLSYANVVIYIGYIPPKDKETAIYLKHIEAIRSIIIEPNDILLVLGDYNLPNINWIWDDDLHSYFPTNQSNEVAECFLNGMFESGLFQTSNIANRYGNVLDYVFISEPNIIDVSKAPATLTAAAEKSINHERIHYPLEWNIELFDNKTSSKKPKPKPIKCVKKADFHKMNEYWYQIDIDTFTSINSIEESTKLFYDKMSECIDLYIPTVTPKAYSNLHPPWFDSTLINLKNKRDKARKRIKTLGSSHEFDALNEEFSTYHNQRVIEYQNEQNRLCKANPKKFWQYVNSQRSTKGYPTHFEYDNKQTSDENESAQLFNEFFATVFTPEDPTFSIEEFIQNHNLNDDPFERISEEEVLSELEMIDPTKGVGLDDLHPLILKSCAKSLSKIICYLFNKSIESGEVPKIWKRLKIIPIHKSGGRSLIKQYRPIAIPPCIAKIQDKIMTKRLNKAIGNQITIHQHGFVKKRNTSTNVLELTQHGFNAFEENSQLDVFFADFSKAFDKVQHSLLIKKLASLGLSKTMLKWQWSFLKDRTQITKIGNGSSNEIPITSGIIQGGHQSPICFSAIINDLPEFVKEAITESFADDTKIFMQIKNTNDAYKLQSAINDFTHWCIENKLEINEDKCYIMTISRKSNTIHFDYSINSNIIKRILEHRDLGIIIDSKLTMIPHIEKQVNKAKGMLALIRRLSNGLFNQNTMRTLYMSLVRSHLDYASVVYNPNYDVHSNKIESIQKQFLLYAMKDEQRTEDFQLRPYSERCGDMKLTSLHRRRINSGIIFIYDLIEKNLISATINEKIKKREQSTYSLRKKEFLDIPITTKSYQYNNPFLVMCRNFNKISNIFIQSQTRTEFINKITKIPDETFE